MLTLLAALSLSAQDNALSDDEKKAGFKLLFDGKTTEGWRTWKKDKLVGGWTVVEGVLTRSAGGGDILTVEQFADFELKIDWRVAPGGNSGIMYRVAETEGAPYMTGPEYQVLDNAKHADGKNPKTSSGSFYAVYPPTKDVCKPAGEWNSSKIVANGKKIEHWLNGEKVVECEIGSEDWLKRVADSKWKTAKKYGLEAKGHIDLQDHGDKVEYKNIKIREIK
ncbi:MAG TPA: DUF1080 domain-containing protein [Planctomycetota bacterium]